METRNISEIKFRGKRTDNGNWIYGFVVCPVITDGVRETHIVSEIRNGKPQSHAVNPTSVGQYTNTEDKNGIEKSHSSDAFCIAGNLQAKRNDNITIGRCVPRHGRSMHVFVPTTGGKRRSAIASHWIGKSRLQRFDTVRYEERECIISGSTNGRPILKNVDWTKATSSPSVNQKTVLFLSRKHGSIIYQMFNNQHV